MSDSNSNETVINNEAYLPQDVMLLIALHMSVFDVPQLVLVYRFLAANSNILWQHHTLRHFEYPPLLFPDAIKTGQMNWHGLFFKHYRSDLSVTNVIYRTWSIQISEGNIHNILEGKSPFKVLPCNEFIPLLFNFSQENPSLFQLTHASTEENKHKLLDYYHKDILVPFFFRNRDERYVHMIPQASLKKLLRNALNLSTMNYESFLNFFLYLSNTEITYGYSTPLIKAINTYNTEIILLLLKCGADMNESSNSGIIAAKVFITTIGKMSPAELSSRRDDPVFSKQDADLFEYIKIYYPDLYELIPNKDDLVPNKNVDASPSLRHL